MARKWVKYALLISILLCSVVAFFGCGGQKQAKTQGDIVEVRFGYPGGVGDYEAIKNQIIPMFEKENPNIKIKLEYQPWNQFFTKLKTQIAANEAPDFWVSDGVYVMEYADRGALLDLTEWINRDLAQEDFFALDFAKDANGKIWGVPREIQTIGLYYNKNSFNDAGVEYPNESWNWDSLLEASKKLTRDTNGDKRIDQYGFWSANWVSGGWFNFIYQNDGAILDETRTKSMLNKAESIEAVKFMVDMVHKYKVSPTDEVSSSVGGGNAIFQANVVAMYPNVCAMSASFNKAKDLDYDAAVLPKGKVRATSYNANPFVVNAKTKPEQAKAAWEFIKYFASNETVQKLWAEGAFGIPILKKVVYSKYFADAPTRPNNKLAFIEPLEKSYGMPMDLNKCWNEWRTALTQSLSLAWLGQLSAEDAMLKAHKDVQKVLDRAYAK